MAFVTLTRMPQVIVTFTIFGIRLLVPTAKPRTPYESEIALFTNRWGRNWGRRCPSLTSFGKPAGLFSRRVRDYRPCGLARISCKIAQHTQQSKVSLSGEPPKWIGILEYPSIEDALAHDSSPAYAALKPVRDKSTNWRAYVVEGL